jgi:PhnB protein
MMTQLNPYLRFNGNCREAMTFYKECLGGELAVQTVGESPLAGQMPPEAKQNVMHASLTKGDLVLLASDTMAPGDIIKGTSISLSLNCSSEEEIRTYFSNLSVGGKITYPLHVEFWGAIFGILTDKYGNEWYLNYDKK